MSSTFLKKFKQAGEVVALLIVKDVTKLRQWCDKDAGEMGDVGDCWEIVAKQMTSTQEEFALAISKGRR